MMFSYSKRNAIPRIQTSLKTDKDATISSKMRRVIRLLHR